MSDNTYNISKNRAILLSSIASYLDSRDSCYIDNIYYYIVVPINKNYNNHFLSIVNNSDFTISYALNEDSKLDENKRIKTTFGRYVRRMLNVSIYCVSDYELSTFVNDLAIIASKKKCDFDKGLKIYVGNDLLIKMEEFEDGSCKSCMTKWKANDPKNPLRLYKENPNKVGLLVHTENNKVVGRALIWRTDNGSFVIDRIYGKNYKINAWCSLKNIESVYGNELSEKVTLKFNKKWGGPYLDSFRIGKLGKNTVVLSSKYYEPFDVEFSSSKGRVKFRYKCNFCNSKRFDCPIVVNNRYICNSCKTECPVCKKLFGLSIDYKSAYGKCKHLKKNTHGSYYFG